MQTQFDLQQFARDNENQERTNATPISNSPKRFFTVARKKSSKTNQAENRAQVTIASAMARLPAAAPAAYNFFTGRNQQEDPHDPVLVPLSHPGIVESGLQECSTDRTVLE